MEDRKVKAGQIYRHFKGTEYLVLCLGIDTETGEPVVVYRDNSDESAVVWVRPLKTFKSKVDIVKDPDAKQKYRFELLK